MMGPANICRSHIMSGEKEGIKYKHAYGIHI